MSGVLLKTGCCCEEPQSPLCPDFTSCFDCITSFFFELDDVQVQQVGFNDEICCQWDTHYTTVLNQPPPNCVWTNSGQQITHDGSPDPCDFIPGASSADLFCAEIDGLAFWLARLDIGYECPGTKLLGGGRFRFTHPHLEGEVCPPQGIYTFLDFIAVPGAELIFNGSGDVILT